MITNQAYLFLIFTIDGIIIGLLFDFFRILRKIIKTNNIFTYLEDIIFWILTGIIILYSIYYFNNGEIRIYMFIGIILGILSYILTISKYIISFFVSITEFIIKIINYIINVIFSPIKKIINIIKKIFFKPINFLIINLKKLINLEKIKYKLKIIDKFLNNSSKFIKKPKKTT